MRISDWSSDVCSSDLCIVRPDRRGAVVGFLSGRTVHHLGNESMLVPMTVKTPTLSTQRVPRTFAPRPGGRKAVPPGPAQRVPELPLYGQMYADRKSTRLNSSHYCAPRMPSSA